MSSGNLADVECRVLTYSHDGFGMGHLRRNINVTTRFLADAPESSVLMLVGCSPESYFELPAGIDFIKLPSIVKVATGVHQLSSLRIGQLQAEALRNSLIKRVADVYRRDLQIDKLRLLQGAAADLDDDFLVSQKLQPAHELEVIALIVIGVAPVIVVVARQEDSGPRSACAELVLEELEVAAPRGPIAL